MIPRVAGRGGCQRVGKRNSTVPRVAGDQQGCARGWQEIN